jgi:hypothetical protein
MTSSSKLNKFISIGAALLLAAGGSLVATDAAHATDITSVSSAFTPQGGSTSISLAVAGCTINAFANPTPTPQVADFTVTGDSGTLAISSVSLGGYISIAMANALVGGDHLTISYVKNGTAVNQIPCQTSGNFVGSFSGVTATVAAAPPTMIGTSGNLNGTVGIALSMAAYSTTGLTSPVVYSYTVSNGSIPAGVSFNSATGQFTGTPTAAASNLGVTVTATGANALTATAGFNFTVTGGSNNNGNNNQNAPTQTVAPTITVVGNSAVVTAGTYSSGTVMGNWEYCLTAKTAVNAPSNNPPSSDCGPLFLTSSGSSYSNVAHALTLDLTATYYARAFGSMNSTLSAVSLDGKFVRYQEFNNNGFFTGTVSAVAGGSSNSSSSNNSSNSSTTPSVAAPTWQAPIVNQVPNLSKALTTAGGQISLKDDSFTGLKSVTVGGKPVTITVGANGSVTIPVPAGQTGSADLTLTFDTGTITIIGGIKYVVPVDVAAVPLRDIAVAAGTTKVTEALVDQVRQAALSNMTNTAVQCVAYATSGSASAMAAAKSVATKVCGLAVKANPTLQVTSVSVVVNKAKARKTAVGIKVYKQN